GLVQFMNHGQIVKLDVSQTILQTTAIIVVPICIGMLIRIKNKKFANTMSGPVRKASVIILVLVIIVLVSNEKNNVVHYFEQAGLAAMLLNVISMLVGYFSAKLFKISDYRSLSIAIESGNQNGTMAIAIAVVLLGNTSFAIAPAIYSLLMFITGGMVISLGIEIYKIRLIKDSRSAS
ncbi:MAG: hypothetical protein MI922_08325, partial [Bacteroidales bacterium]|nr:hypothetical protein [Bacteroidales bacterium]